MDTSSPCAACSWTPWRQEHCEYASHVRLSRGYEDRGIWKLGTDYILKERPATDYDTPNSETLCLKFLQDNSTISVPNVIKDWVDGDGRYFQMQEFVRGETLEAVWHILSDTEKNQIADEMTHYLLQLRQFQSPRVEAFGGQPVLGNYLFLTITERLHGPFDSDDALYNDLISDLDLPDKASQALRNRLPRCAPYTLTHANLSISNIIVTSGRFAGIAEWETAGYFPLWWEWVRASVGHGKDDTDWKAMLRERMEHFNEAQEFWDYLRILDRSTSGRHLDERRDPLIRRLTEEATDGSPA